MPQEFILHAQLQKDTVTVGDLPLCRVLLAKDARFPWIILVPRQPGLREWHDLTEQDRAILTEEIAALSKAMQAAWGADKTNVAALGNMVPQLHIHIVMRFTTDPAWPGPIWGVGTAEAYDDAVLAETLTRIRACFP